MGVFDHSRNDFSGLLDQLTGEVDTPLAHVTPDLFYEWRESVLYLLLDHVVMSHGLDGLDGHQEVVGLSPLSVEPEHVTVDGVTHHVLHGLVGAFRLGQDVAEEPLDFRHHPARDFH